MSYHNQIVSRYSLNEELKAKWDRLWHFFRISQQFGLWDVKMKGASEKERNLIMKTQQILTKHGTSLRITIPKEIGKHLNLVKGNLVELWVDNHRIVMEKKK